MKYSVEKFKIDLGETPIGNIFLNQYLQVTTGNQLEMYLYCHKLAKDTSVNMDIPNEEITEALDLTESEVSECWNYWLDEGVIKRYTNTETQTNHTVFLGLRQLCLGIANPEPDESQKTHTPQNNQRIKKMSRGIEDTRDMELSKSEMERILGHISTYHQTPELVVTALRCCTTNPNTRNNTSYVLQVLRNWKLDGIMTLEQWQEENSRRQRRKTRRRTHYKPKTNGIENKATNINSKFLNDFIKKSKEQKDR